MATRIAHLDHERAKRRGDSLMALVAATQEGATDSEIYGKQDPASHPDDHREPHSVAFYVHALIMLALTVAIPCLIITTYVSSAVRAWFIPVWVAAMVTVVALAASEARAMYIDERR